MGAATDLAVLKGGKSRVVAWAHVSMLSEDPGSSASDTNLDEANVSGALAEASSADEHVVLADQACREVQVGMRVVCTSEAIASVRVASAGACTRMDSSSS